MKCETCKKEVKELYDDGEKEVCKECKENRNSLLKKENTNLNTKKN